MGKLDVQGLIRTTITIGAIVGGYYYAMGRLDSHVENRDIHKTTSQLADMFVLRLDSHVENRDIHKTTSQLADMFVLRREWESNHSTLKDDVRYLRNKIDAIYDKVSDGGGRK